VAAEGPFDPPKGPFWPVLALFSTRFQAGGVPKLVPGTFSARGPFGGAGMHIWGVIGRLLTSEAVRRPPSCNFEPRRVGFLGHLADFGPFLGRFRPWAGRKSPILTPGNAIFRFIRFFGENNVFPAARNRLAFLREFFSSEPSGQRTWFQVDRVRIRDFLSWPRSAKNGPLFLCSPVWPWFCQGIAFGLPWFPLQVQWLKLSKSREKKKKYRYRCTVLQIFSRFFFQKKKKKKSRVGSLRIDLRSFRAI